MDETELPIWFDASRHFIATGGVFETATGILLDADGAPQSLAVWASLDAMAARALADAQAGSAAITAMLAEAPQPDADQE